MRPTVYLRARGGTSFASAATLANLGLSPRTRRNPALSRQFLVYSRSISAHAEEPSPPVFPAGLITVYLRARGGTLINGVTVPRHWGLSPRTRRNLGTGASGGSSGGSISAHAEEPDHTSSGGITTGVYLRARGGTHKHRLLMMLDEGLSPRTRRNRTPKMVDIHAPRSISAHAEEPC
ncbi:Hypothetical protein GbCGDNIH9_7112a [Granulibacter bethesdensis]|uniref:Uncharacterized protein n=1 Tax=Granulibacter bethesdensis TaxID=364410 RepID=A0AAC9KBQ5_9PROT|nr:Hypothetical protein GbCGDNIH9_7112a [Granulibacter bethesdensis]APH62586.1 Hypothetical protein GbCGDNIH8_7112d [Granulibacter bethesdensis]